MPRLIPNATRPLENARVAVRGVVGITLYLVVEDEETDAVAMGKSDPSVTTLLFAKQFLGSGERPHYVILTGTVLAV